MGLVVSWFEFTNFLHAVIQSEYILATLSAKRTSFNANLT